LSEAFLFIAVDPISSLGHHVLQAEQLPDRRTQSRAAPFARIRAVALDPEMHVAALGADEGNAGLKILAFLLHRQNDLINDIARAFVVDDGSWAEL